MTVVPLFPVENAGYGGILSLPEAATIAKVHPLVVEQWCMDYDIAMRIEGEWLIHADELHNLLRGCTCRLQKRGAK
jgi:hypothetical protein